MALSIQTAPIKYKDPTTGNFVEIVGVQGPAGTAGSGIASIAKTSTSGLVDTYTITFDNNNTTTFTVTNGSSISTIEKTNTSGLIDTYTVTLSNGNTSTFTVINGQTPNISMGTVTEGTTAAASFSGTASNLVLNLTLPKGDQGDTYTLNANDRAEIAALVDDAVFVQTVSGATPSITGQANFRYICGEVSTLSITPPASGTIIVRFNSGSTATVLTLPNTVKMPDWWVSPETNTTYELCIEDGVYGSVMQWAT